MAIIRGVSRESDANGEYPRAVPLTEKQERIRRILDDVERVAQCEGTTRDRHETMSYLVLNDIPWLIETFAAG